MEIKLLHHCLSNRCDKSHVTNTILKKNFLSCVRKLHNQSHASWSWKAGGAPSATNSATSGAMTANSVSLNGTLQSAYTPSGSPTIYPEKMSINTEAGFSMITYEGNGTDNATVPHGLSSAPEMSWIHQYANNGGSTTNWDVSTVVPSSQTGTSFNLDTNGAWFSPTNGGHTRGAKCSYSREWQFFWN